MNPRLAIVLLVLGACSVGAMAVGLAGAGGNDEQPASVEQLSDGPPTPFEGSVLPAGVRAPDFTLRDQDDEPVTMRSLRGKPAIVTFLYTNCEETCPAQAQLVKAALDELGHDVPALAIAVDPPRDTPESARAFLADSRMSGRMDFALGSRAELEPVWKGFAIQAQTDGLEHQARILLVDGKGMQRVSFPLDVAIPAAIAHDLRVLEEEAG